MDVNPNVLYFCVEITIFYILISFLLFSQYKKLFVSSSS